MIDNVVIRPATEKDFPMLHGLLYDLGRPKPQKDSDVELFRKLFTKYVQDSDKAILVAELDGMKVIGMMGIMFVPRLNQFSLEIYIPELVVHEKYHNHGIGKKLINFCITLAKEKKCYRIRLESANERTNSHEFYKHLGFDQYGFSFTMNFDKPQK